MKCPTCGFDNPPDARFCGMCGSPLLQVCGNCGHANPLDFRFCTQCGTPLAPGAVRPAAVQAPLPLWIPSQAGSEPSSPSLEIPGLDGERRIATVILADVQNSTDLMEKIGTEAWVSLMNRLFQLLEAEIYRFGGEVEQFRGDGLVAFFGAHVANEDDPEHAILAGLSMQRALGQYADQLEQDQGIQLKLRVGVNTGEVVVATVGDIRQHREYTAMGEAVAMAARMETSAEPGTVLVSENTYQLVRLRFKWLDLGEMMVKGVSRPINVYRPLEPQPYAEQALDFQTDVIPVSSTGRTIEFEVLRQSIQNLQEGRGSIVLVIGEKGMGKSLLVTQVRQHFMCLDNLDGEGPCPDMPVSAARDAQKPAIWLTGRCRSYDQSWPYSMWRDLIKHWLGMRPDETSEESSARLFDLVEPLWGAEVERYFPYLATFLSLPVEDRYAERVRHLSAEALQREFFTMIYHWVEALAARSSMVFSFVDIQWADTRSLELIKHCLPTCNTLPIVWLVQMRPDRESPAWMLHDHVESEFSQRMTEILLRPLNENESAQLIDQMAGPDVLSKETTSLVIQKAEGYPFFVQELLHMLMAQGVLVQDGETGTWQQVREVTSLDLPNSLQSMVLSRIDRLPPAEKRALQLAAVIGPIFWENVLETLYGGQEPVKEALAGLKHAQLIHERSVVPGVGMEYVFHSSLVREVAYESLLSGQRSAYHLQAAHYLEDNLEVEVGEQFDSAIAYHYRSGGDIKKELFYTMTAAERARRVYANRESHLLYDRALELLDLIESRGEVINHRSTLLGNRFEVLCGRREIHYLNGDIDDARADSRALLPIAEQLADDPVWMIDALTRQPEVADPDTRNEIVERGLPMAKRARDLSVEVGDKRREMYSLVSISQLYLVLKEPGWQEQAERALELARQLKDLRAEVDLLLAIGDGYGLNNPDRAHEYLDAALSISQKLDDKGIEMTLLSAVGPEYERQGDYYRQLTEYELKRVAISRELGNRIWEGHALMFCGQIQALYLGDYQGGMPYLEEALALWENTDGKVYPMLRIAQVQTALGNYSQAQATLDACRPLCYRGVVDLGRAGLELVEAILYNAIGEEGHLKQVLELTDRVKQFVDDNIVPRQYDIAANCQLAHAHLQLANLCEDEPAQEEHRIQALKASLAALEIYKLFGFMQIVECVSEEILYRHSQALAANGREQEAREVIKQAYDEMMRKHAFIPEDTPFRQTYLEAIDLHRQIQAAYAAALS